MLRNANVKFVETIFLYIQLAQEFFLNRLIIAFPAYAHSLFKTEYTHMHADFDKVHIYPRVHTPSNSPPPSTTTHTHTQTRAHTKSVTHRHAVTYRHVHTNTHTHTHTHTSYIHTHKRTHTQTHTHSPTRTLTHGCSQGQEKIICWFRFFLLRLCLSEIHVKHKIYLLYREA